MATETDPVAAAAAIPLDDDAYPPSPWELHGQSHMHVLLVPSHRLPPLPHGFRPLRLAGRALVITGFVDYQSGSVLNYGEVFAAVVGTAPATGRRRPTATVTHMWVDSPASRRGGRELWGYPKELADFELRIDPGGSASARVRDSGGEGALLARSEYRVRVALPRAIRTRSGTVQPLGGRLVSVCMRARLRPSLGSGRWDAPPESPLDWTAHGRRLLSLGLRNFHFRFGD